MKWPFPKKGRQEPPTFWQEYQLLFREPLPPEISGNTFVVLDTETTGFHLDSDRILCLGALKLQGGKILVRESMETYLLQEHYDVQSAPIHGIRKKGKQDRIPELEALKEFLRYAKNHVLVGHHVMFDVTMINAALARHGLPKLRNRTLDTALLYKRTLLVSSVLQKKEKYGLDELADKFGISKKDRHTALGDALITAYAFLRILEKLSPRNLRDLLRKQDPPRIGL